MSCTIVASIVPPLKSCTSADAIHKKTDDWFNVIQNPMMLLHEEIDAASRQRSEQGELVR